MKFSISTCFPKERCSLTWHYQICSPLFKVSLCWLHVPQPLHSSTVAPLSLRDTRSLLGELGIHSEGEQNHSLPQVPKLHTERTQCVLKNQATASSHHLCHWPCVLLQWPKMARKLIHQQNPNHFLTGLGTESAPQEVPSSASWWGRNTGNGPSLWWHWVISSSLTSNCFLRPPSPTI